MVRKRNWLTALIVAIVCAAGPVVVTTYTCSRIEHTEACLAHDNMMSLYVVSSLALGWPVLFLTTTFFQTLIRKGGV